MRICCTSPCGISMRNHLVSCSGEAQMGGRPWRKQRRKPELPPSPGRFPPRLSDEQHRQEIMDVFSPHIPVMTALVFPANAFHAVFLTEGVVLFQAFPEAVLSAHAAEQQAHVLKKFRLSDILQMAVVRLFSNQVM